MLQRDLNHRAHCSRKHFLVASAAAAALAGCSGGAGVMPSAGQRSPFGSGQALNTGSLDPATITNVAPVPIPPNPNLGGLHLQIPTQAGDEMSTIYDFDGLIGRAEVSGVGTGNGVPLFWAADFAFLQGEFRSTSGQLAQGTFGFT